MTSSMMILSAAYCFALALFHLMFWRLFQWPASLAASGSINVSVTQTLNLMLTFAVTVYGVALLWGAFHLDRTSWTLPAAGALFLAVRVIVQPFQFSMRDTTSRVLTAIFVAGAVIHVTAACML